MRLFIILFSIIISTQAISQPRHLRGLDRNELATYYIKFLQEGSLLVRLQTKSRKIEILKRAGNIAAAEKVAKDQLKINLSIVKAFNDAFTFCPVYFFYSNDSKLVMTHELDKVKFLDKNLKPKSIVPPENYLTAEFSIIKEDTVQNAGGNRYVGGTYYERDSVGGIKEIKYYSGGTNMSFGALIIKSDQFIQLMKPFPFYARTLATLPMLRRSHFKVVTMMNDQLKALYLLKS